MNQRTFNSALLLGVTSGLRSMMAPALLSLSARRAGTNRHWLLASSQVASALTAMAIGELVFDKLPFAPSRISPAALSGRLLVGAMCGAAVSPRDERAGALLGVAGALASSFAGYAIRRALGRATRVPDPFIALVEDGLAIGIGMTAANMDNEKAAPVIRMPSAHVA